MSWGSMRSLRLDQTRAPPPLPVANYWPINHAVNKNKKRCERRQFWPRLVQCGFDVPLSPSRRLDGAVRRERHLQVPRLGDLERARALRGERERLVFVQKANSKSSKPPSKQHRERLGAEA